MENTKEESMFWKLFGPTLVSIIGLLLMLILNNANSNILSTRTEIMVIVNEHTNDIKKLKEQMQKVEVIVEEFKSSTKDKIAGLELSVKERNNEITLLRDKVIKLEEKSQILQPLTPTTPSANP